MLCAVRQETRPDFNVQRTADIYPPTYCLGLGQKLHRGARYHAYLVLAVVALCLASRSSIAEGPPSLQIATWDVSQAEKSIFKRSRKSKKRSWRHTFGAERADRKSSRVGWFNLDVDVVLLQGVRSVRALKRVFPARTWRLILSRDYTKYAPALSRLPADLRLYDIAATERTASHAMTAVAIRYQRRLRVRGVHHIAVPEKSTADEQSDKRADLPSGTAVRINHYGTTYWLLSLAGIQGCQGHTQDCPLWRAAHAWRKTVERPATDYIIAGVSAPEGSDDVDTTATSSSGAGATAPDVEKAEAAADARCGELLPLVGEDKPHALLLTPEQRVREKLGCIVLGTAAP